METSTPPADAINGTEPELHLWLEEDHTGDWRRWRKAALWSGVFHLFVIAVLLVIPDTPVTPLPEPKIAQRVTPLYIPKEFTQTAPNKGKLDKQLSVEAIAPRPVVKAPSPGPATVAKRTAPSAPLPPPPQVVKIQPMPILVEPPPKIQTDDTSQSAQIAKLIAPPPPPPAEPPKLALEQVGPPPKTTPAGPRPGTLAIPNTSVEAAVHSLARSGLSAGQVVGDAGADDPSIGNGLNLPPSVGRPRSSLELKSDPLGVDFRPYMLQVLAAVRRNWFAVYPEAARLGQRGSVTLEFAIEKQGKVAKIVFMTESGAKALDQSAVAAISASNPMPSLPTGYRGDRIVLQMTFLYNMPR